MLTTYCDAKISYKRFKNAPSFMAQVKIYLADAKGNEISNKARYFSVYYSIATKDMEFEETNFNRGNCFLSRLSTILNIDEEELTQQFKKYNAITNPNGGNLFCSIHDGIHFMEEFLQPHCTVLKLTNTVPKIEVY